MEILIRTSTRILYKKTRDCSPPIMAPRNAIRTAAAQTFADV